MNYGSFWEEKNKEEIKTKTQKCRTPSFPRRKKKLCEGG